MQSIWAHLGLNQRITLSLAALGVVGGIIALLLWAHHPSMQLLYGRLGDKDVSEIVATIHEQGIQYQIGNGGTSVYVPTDQVHKVRMLLASKGIPAGEGVGFEIFDRSNFGVSDFVQRTNYLRAVQGELARTIAQLQGVRSARVMIVMPENRLLFSDQKVKPTASVFIDTSSSGLPQDNVNAIRFLVANSVEGLHADDVALIDSHGNLLTENLKEDGSLAVASSQVKYRKSVEDYFASKVETMLAKVLGSGKAVVRVSAEIDSESSTRTQEVYDPDAQVLRNEQTSEDSTTTTEVDGSGASQNPTVGVSANTPASASTDASKAGKNSEQVHKNKSSSYELNRTTTNAVRAPGAIKSLSAAVFVAPKDKPRTPEEINALRQMVANALGIKTDNPQDVTKSVTIEETAFETSPSPKSGGMGDLIASYSNLLKNIGASIVALALLLFFFRMLKQAKPDEIQLELLQAASGSGIRGARSSGVTPDLLNEMIRQKPANVGVALRGWMANGGSKS